MKIEYWTFWSLSLVETVVFFKYHLCITTCHLAFVLTIQTLLKDKTKSHLVKFLIFTFKYINDVVPQYPIHLVYNSVLDDTTESSRSAPYIYLVRYFNTDSEGRFQISDDFFFPIDTNWTYHFSAVIYTLRLLVFHRVMITYLSQYVTMEHVHTIRT